MSNVAKPEALIQDDPAGNEAPVIFRLRESLRGFLTLDHTSKDFHAAFVSMQARAQIVLDTAVKKTRGANIAERQRNALIARQKSAKIHAAKVQPFIKQLRDEGKSSFDSIAAGLEALGVPAPRAKRWHGSTVRNIERLKID